MHISLSGFFQKLELKAKHLPTSRGNKQLISNLVKINHFNSEAFLLQTKTGGTKMNSAWKLYTVNAFDIIIYSEKKY